MRLLAFLALILAALLGYLQYRLWFGIGNIPAVKRLQVEVAAQIRQNTEFFQRNDALAAEVADLKTGDVAIEERARNELGMIKSGELFYRIIDKEGILDEPATSTPETSR